MLSVSLNKTFVSLSVDVYFIIWFITINYMNFCLHTLNSFIENMFSFSCLLFFKIFVGGFVGFFLFCCCCFVCVCVCGGGYYYYL